MGWDSWGCFQLEFNLNIGAVEVAYRFRYQTFMVPNE